MTKSRIGLAVGGCDREGAVRFEFLRRIARLAPLATAFCTTAALGQVYQGAGLPVPMQPAGSSGFYANASSGSVSASPAAAAPLPPSSLVEPSGSWLSGGYASKYQPLGNFDPICDDCPKRGVVAFASYDSFRGISDGGWQNNGISSGLNFGTRLGRFSDLTGVGFQLGGSAAAYDWAGTDYRTAHQNQAEPQGFITYGLFRRPNENSNWSAALVQDWMLNANYGLFAQNPTLGQWRAQVGYALSASNEVGIWGTWRAHGDSRDVPGFGPTSWRPIDQLNVFARHKWSQGGPDTSLWIGVPERDRLGGNGSLGDYLVGILGNFPLSDRLAAYALVTYMHQSAAPGPAGSNEDAWNFSIGLAFYPGQNARSNTIAGRCWMPMMPVANNGYFLVDTNRTF